MATDNLPAVKENEGIKSAIRARALELLKEQMDHAILITRCEGSAADNIRMLTELRNLAGLEEKSKYDNIPHVTVMFGQDFSQKITVEPVRAQELVEEVVDVEAKAPAPAPALPGEDKPVEPAPLLPELAHLDSLLEAAANITPLK